MCVVVVFKAQHITHTTTMTTGVWGFGNMTVACGLNGF